MRYEKNLGHSFMHPLIYLIGKTTRASYPLATKRRKRLFAVEQLNTRYLSFMGDSLNAICLRSQTSQFAAYSGPYLTYQFSLVFKSLAPLLLYLCSV